MGGKSGKLSYNKVDLTGKTAIVTGANTGIGYYTARDLMLMGARVIIACRSEEKAKAAMLRLEADAVETLGESEAGARAQPEFISLDLSSLASVVEFSREFKSRGYPLHLLVCNAGGFFANQEYTKDENEMHFQVNYLGHFLLTLHLLPVLRNSGSDCRVINVSSVGHESGLLNLANIQAQQSYKAPTFYGNSKLFQIMTSCALQRRLVGSDVTVYSLHPGYVETNIPKNLTGPWKTGFAVGRFLGMVIPPDEGAITTLYVATDPQVPKISGSYFSDCLPVAPHSRALKEKDQEVVWNYSLERLQNHVTPDLLETLQLPPKETQE